MSHFKLICSTKASNVVPVHKYVSQKTGITVILAAVEGPIVNLYFCLATEAQDDDGLPHTLKHLVFLGSEHYPYKGVLDLLAYRCMAHGRNAWTENDHSCYTIYTAGDAAMLTLLPIYLDHILRPTLSDEAFLTEVHHIDADGEDAGVVYCEMQERENSFDRRCDLKLQRAMYPNSGYSFETSGIMKNLRESTNNTKVKDYHKKFYRPENLTIILTGQIEAEDLFKVLATVEDDIIAKREKETVEEWVKPWQTIPPPPNYGEITEQWPADNEDYGHVLFGWRGPFLSDVSAIKDLAGCESILRYLCDTASAPLQRCLVVREDPLAEDVSYNLTENMAPLIKIELNNVPFAKLDAARTEAQECIKKIRSGDEVIDMERMKMLLKKQLKESVANLESDPHHAIAFRCICDALYSQSEQDFVLRFNPQQSMHELLEESSTYWLELVQKYFTDELVTVIGSPSIELQAKMEDEERKRIGDRIALLGESGLEEKAQQLEQAVEFNERLPPAGILESVPVPSCDNLKCYKISTWSTDCEPCPYFDVKEVPFYTRLHSLTTNFVYINLIIDTSDIDQETRKWLPLLLNSLAELPVRRGDTLIPHEEVISMNENLTVAFSNEIGFEKRGNFTVGQYSKFMHIEVRCDPSDYVAVVNHLYEVLYAAEFTKERLLVFAKRIIDKEYQIRHNGYKMAYDILRDSLYSNDSNVHWSSVLRQTRFLRDVVERVTAGGDCADEIIAAARDAWTCVTAQKRLSLHMAADLTRCTLPTEPWKQFAGTEITRTQPKLYRDADVMSGWGGGFVVGVDLEKSFLVQLIPGLTGFEVGDVASLRVALNYLAQLEGLMWRMIHGSYFSDGYEVRVSHNEAAIMLSLYRASNVPAAYSRVKNILKDLLGRELHDEMFSTAKSTALFEIVEIDKSPATVVKQSLMNYIKQVGENYNRELISAISAVQKEQVASAAAEWLPTLFDAKRSKLSVVCHPGKVKDMQAAFKGMNIELEAYESMEASHFN